MTLQQESLIEAFALNPSSLSEAETSEVISLINSSEEATALHSRLQSFYEAFNSQEYVVTQRLERFIDHLSGLRSVIRLRPRRTVRQDSRTGSIAAPKLAAATRMHRAFELIGSSMAEDGLTDVRFIRDVAAAKVRIYIISDDEKSTRNALLLFDGSSVHIMTDELGQASIEERQFEQLRLIERNAFIRPVQYTFQVDPKELGQEWTRVGREESSMRAKATSSDVYVDFNEDELVAFRENRADGDWQRIEINTRIDLSEAGPSPFRIRVYA